MLEKRSDVITINSINIISIGIIIYSSVNLAPNEYLFIYFIHITLMKTDIKIIHFLS